MVREAREIVDLLNLRAITAHHQDTTKNARIHNDINDEVDEDTLDTCL